MIFRGVLRADQIRRANEALSRPWQAHIRIENTDRILEILELDPVFAEMVDELPSEVTHILDEVVGQGWTFGSYHALVLHPEAAPLSQEAKDRIRSSHLHSDFPYGHATPAHGGNLTSVSPRFPYICQLLWMLSPFEQSTGATMVLPGSHLGRRLPVKSDAGEEGSDYSRFAAGAVHAIGQPGDLMLYIGQVWHTFRENEGRAPRTAILGQVTPFFYVPMENHAWTTPARLARRMPPRARERLGIPWDHFFMHSSRFVPVPTGPVRGISQLADMLLYGFPGRMPDQLLRNLLQASDPRLLDLAAAFFQINRWVAIVVLLCPACCWGTRRVPLRSAACYLGLLLLGMLLGTNLTLDRLRM